MATATEQPSSRNAVLDVEVPRGLKGVKVAQTSIGNVRGQEGFFHYRQYDATELAKKRTLEDIWHLMHEGTLPATQAESDAYRAQAGQLRPHLRRDAAGITVSLCLLRLSCGRPCPIRS